MKLEFKHLLMFVLVIGINYSAFSQWQPTGNNVTTGQYLGSNNNMPLRIFTNGVERAQFTIGNALFSPIAPANSGAGLHFFRSGG